MLYGIHADGPFMGNASSLWFFALQFDEFSNDQTILTDFRPL